ncbi:MAG: hypothetical protein ACI9BD_001138 [Candidatus Marinamargulisbacteria bacterium]|jgi:hypothetical protein
MTGPSKIIGLPHAARVTETDKGTTKQELNSYDPKTYSLSYSVIEGTSSFVKSAVYHWSLTDMGKGKTGLNATLSIDTIGIKGKRLSPIMKMKMTKIFGNMVEEFKYFVDEGKPHPRKVESMANPKG